MHFVASGGQNFSMIRQKSWIAEKYPIHEKKEGCGRIVDIKYRYK